jgi:hypothetical protein
MNEKELREKGLDETLAESFPSSDPPSTIPDPISAESTDETAPASLDSTVSKLDTAFRNMLQSSFDATGIKCDVRQVEDKIVAQPLASYGIALAGGFILGGGLATRIGWITLALLGWRAVSNAAKKEPSGTNDDDNLDLELTSI